jgi:hypothetical protein
VFLALETLSPLSKKILSGKEEQIPYEPSKLKNI